jgi:hypothetical protein
MPGIDFTELDIGQKAFEQISIPKSVVDKKRIIEKNGGPRRRRGTRGR